MTNQELVLLLTKTRDYRQTDSVCIRQRQDAHHVAKCNHLMSVRWKRYEGGGGREVGGREVWGSNHLPIVSMSIRFHRSCITKLVNSSTSIVPPPSSSAVRNIMAAHNIRVRGVHSAVLCVRGLRATATATAGWRMGGREEGREGRGRQCVREKEEGMWGVGWRKKAGQRGEGIKGTVGEEEIGQGHRLTRTQVHLALCVES